MANPILYVMVNSDLPSMNPGKAQAHSGHAVSAFMTKAFIQPGRVSDIAKEWFNQTSQGFGTQVNLKVPFKDVPELIGDAVALGYFAELVCDPTYPFIVPNKELLSLIDTKHFSAPSIEKDDGS